MRKVAIVGTGTLPWKSRYAEKSFRALGLEASKKALQQAGVTQKDVDHVTYSIYCETMLRQQIPEPLLQDYLGTQGTSSTRVTGGAAGEMYALQAAYAQIASGMSDLTLFVAVQKGQDFYAFDTRSRGDGILRGFSISADTTWLQPVMPGVPAYLTAFCLQPHIEKYGGPTPRQLAKVSVKNYENAFTNPEAQIKRIITEDEVLNSRIIAYPTTAMMCCLYSDQAAAFVLASEDRAKELTDKPVWIGGVATSSISTSCATADTIGRLRGTGIAAKRAYAMAGIKKPLDELDLIQVHDLVAGAEILAYEELGLCELGQGGRLLDEGVVMRGGKLPSNLDGGRIACGHVGGVSAAYAVCELVRQLREEAGPQRQTRIRHGKALVQAIDGHGSMNGVAVLQRGN
jgi:acetyl-CoA C-acetyltransferase